MPSAVDPPDAQPGLLAVYWPAVVGWVSLFVLVFAERGNPAHWSRLRWGMVGLGVFGLSVTLLLASMVTIRHAEARAPVPLAVNFVPAILWLAGMLS